MESREKGSRFSSKTPHKYHHTRHNQMGNNSDKLDKRLKAHSWELGVAGWTAIHRDVRVTNSGLLTAVME